MTKKSELVGKQKLQQQRIELRNTLWSGEIENISLWDRKTQNGFTTVPRTLPLLGKIMDKLSGTGKPVFSTYLSLWCNVFDDSFIEIEDKGRLAFEAGFSGSRAISTWLSRMRKLEELGFIKSKPGSNGEFNYIILVNPYSVIEDIYNKTSKDDAYNALVARMIKIGAKFE